MREHAFAIAAAVMTFGLLLVGGIVHGTGSSLACPDWPLCYGEIFPPMRGGILFEHSHRLLAAAVGLVTFALAGALHLWRRSDRALRLAGYAAGAIVVAQGALGGVTVLYRLPTAVSTAHLGTAMAFFCLLVWIAWRTRAPRSSEAAAPHVGGRLAVALALGGLYAQILLGALVRHTGAGLGCADLPLCRGELWPASGDPFAEIHMLHRWVGVAVGAWVIAVAARLLRSPAPAVARRLCVAAIGLVCVQIGLGAASVETGLGLLPVTAHLGVAALLLADLLLLHLSLPKPERGRPRLEAAPASPPRSEGAAA